KREYAARTIRPKLLRRLDAFLDELTTTSLDHEMDDVPSSELDLADIGGVMRTLDLEPDADPHVFLHGGTAQARAHLGAFLREGLDGYAERRPDPVDPKVSYLSPYLHFGQISPVAVALAVRGSGASPADIDAFIEELVVRRELALNYVHHEPDYDRYAALPAWARTTLDAHRDDEREALYTAADLEGGRTHDRAWNAAMAQMRETGYLHNHLRMYWGKQVLLWTRSPEQAFRTLLELNDRYFLDGRDPSSVANVAWVLGLHDQAFAERPVSGKTRPMTRAGLDRKLDVKAWLAHVRSTLGDSAVDGPDGEAADRS
ncbi:MAG: deoxyribodipyrimidine photolyase, partial [Candidatus Limnocylindrales bacterium]